MKTSTIFASLSDSLEGIFRRQSLGLFRRLLGSTRIAALGNVENGIACCLPCGLEGQTTGQRQLPGTSTIAVSDGKALGASRLHNDVKARTAAVGKLTARFAGLHIPNREVRKPPCGHGVTTG